MKCIVGLGNPGRKYKKTRHNIGFMVIDELLDRYELKMTEKKFNGSYAINHHPDGKVILLKPQTYMNLSGECIRPLMDYYGINIENLLVIYDDLDLPAGKIRLRQTGGHGGHNGIRSTIDHIGTKKFNRLRVGIGRPIGKMSVIDYVLGKFSKHELQDVHFAIQRAADACEMWLTEPFPNVMNTFN